MMHRDLGIVPLERIPLHEPTSTSSFSFSVRDIRHDDRNIYYIYDYECKT
jgi:hypothetical protein